VSAHEGQQLAPGAAQAAHEVLSQPVCGSVVDTQPDPQALSLAPQPVPVDAPEPELCVVVEPVDVDVDAPAPVVPNL
jgi:hypothetical protein